MPAAVVEYLRHAVTDEARRSNLEPRLLPLTGQTDGIFPARIVPVDVEQLDRIDQVVVIHAEMEAMLDFLPPPRHRLFLLCHLRVNGAGNDGIQIPEVITTIGEPGI